VLALLGAALRLLGTHLYLFTLISLTVWLPGHVLRNYLEFFGPPEDSAIESLRLVLTIQIIFDPLVVSATLTTLGRIKQGLPIGYLTAMVEGLAAWGRLFVVRFIVNCAVALPALAGLGIAPSAPWAVVVGTLLLAVAVVVLALLVRFAVVDSVVVLEGANALTAWRRAAELTEGRRWLILRTAGALFALIFGGAMLVGQVFRMTPELNHFVARVLMDCVLAVSQSLFTIALFLLYWRARAPASRGSAPA